MPSYPTASWTTPTPWTSTRQDRFEERVTRLTVAAGLPLSWVDNTNWQELVQEFIPGAKSPSQKVLIKWLIPSSIAKHQAEAKASVRGLEATVQVDGWTGLNHHHLITVMITVEGKV